MIKAVEQFVFYSLICACIGCSAHKGAEPRVDSEGPKQVAKVGKVQKVTYSEIQIITKTNAKGECPPEKSLMGFSAEKPGVNLLENGKLSLKNLDNSVSSVYKVSLQAIGYDTPGHFFTVVDGKMPSSVPYGLKFTGRPGGRLDIKYLNKSISMNPKRAPIKTFSAVEKRGACEILHDVNIFSENFGVYPLAGR